MTDDRESGWTTYLPNLGVPALSSIGSGWTGADAAGVWKSKVNATVLQLAGRKSLTGRRKTPPRTLLASANETLDAVRAFAGYGNSPALKPADSPEDALLSVTAQQVLTIAFGGNLPRGVSWAEFAECVEAKKRETHAKASLFVETNAWWNILEYLDPDNDEINAASPAFRNFNRKRLPTRGGGRVLRHAIAWESHNPFIRRVPPVLRFAPNGDVIVIDPMTSAAKESPCRGGGSLRPKRVAMAVGAEHWNPGLGVQTKNLPDAYANRLKRAYRVECSLRNHTIALVTQEPEQGTTGTFQIELWDLLAEPHAARHVLRQNDHDGAPCQLELSPDGDLLLACRNRPDRSGHEVVEWDVQTGQRRSSRRGLGVAFCTFLDGCSPVTLTLRQDLSEPSLVDLRSGARLTLPPAAMLHLSARELGARGLTLLGAPMVTGEWLITRTAGLTRNSRFAQTVNMVSLVSGVACSCSTSLDAGSPFVARASRDRSRIAVGFKNRVWVADLRRPQPKAYTADGPITSIDWSLQDTHIATLATTGKVSILQIQP